MALISPYEFPFRAGLPRPPLRILRTWTCCESSGKTTELLQQSSGNLQDAMVALLLCILALRRLETFHTSYTTLLSG